ncbi:MAG TPA: hypothetical protein VMT86_12345 [Bryobacteraceae bacterium]|nr:hypothetical protein [Bryobacteraceae bacterium]
MHQKTMLNFALSRAAAALILIAGSAAAQQTQQQPAPQAEQQYVGKFVLYAGYLNLYTPEIGLVQPGVHIQAGMRWSRHISLGFDYSRGTGDTNVGLSQSTTAIQKEFAPILQSFISGGLLPANYVAALPFTSTTQTFTMGPEFPWRRFRWVTPYIRPSCGMFYDSAVAHPRDHLSNIVVNAIAPSGKEQMWTAFYGFGGGLAFNVSRHFSLIVQGDFVHENIFPDLLGHTPNTFRISIGPGFQFGHNVTKNWF